MSSFTTLYDYVPSVFTDVTPEQERARRAVTEFKDGACPEYVMRDVADSVRKAVATDPGNCTICFVPASRLDLTVLRYMELANFLSQEFRDQVYLNTIELCETYDEVIEEKRRFTCNQARVKGRTVIFIDDIYNTGNSYSAICSLLRESGAKDEVGIYIARVVRP